MPDRCRISEKAQGRSHLLQIYILYAYLFGSWNSLYKESCKSSMFVCI